ncbi:hypothetical protein MRB53_010517 [Persea americana]|uniref:Uncharacterized protein n=1 Tax=Persea americana TaxID=3435 RepID=A0ACC2LS97_PERAE|nr:hypothetical protein MRB53_010517 [Persea americana]
MDEEFIEDMKVVHIVHIILWLCLIQDGKILFGLRESKKDLMYSDIGWLNYSVSFATFSTRTRGQGSDHKEFSSMLHKALEGAVILESFPKTTVDIFALMLEFLY